MRNQRIRLLLLLAVSLTLLLPLPTYADPPGNTVPLSQGWNFISLRNQPPNTAIDAVMNDVSPNVLIVWGYDNTNKVWKKWKPGGTSNTLSSMDIGNGYWVYMVNQAVIDMSQWIPVSSFLPASFYQGWNLIGYNGTDGLSVADALQSVHSQWIIWNWAASTWYADAPTIPSLPATIGPLTNLYQGKAYWVKIKETYALSCGTWDSSVWNNSVWCP